jgi:hypothetical protein
LFVVTGERHPPEKRKRASKLGPDVGSNARLPGY